MNNEDAIKLINKIFEMNGSSLLEKILDYCETYDEDPQEIGEILEEIKEFKDILYRDCVKKHIIKNEEITFNNLEEW